MKMREKEMKIVFSEECSPEEMSIRRKTQRDLRENGGDNGKDAPSPLYILIAMNAMNLMQRREKMRGDGRMMTRVVHESWQQTPQ